MENARSARVEVDGLSLHYVSSGAPDPRVPPVLLLHGWPTSSFLWRNVMPAMATGRQVIALDLPGFGLSDKPLEASYSFRFFTSILDGFLAALKIDRVGLVVHDLGGPIGLYWASQQPAARIERLAVLNTIIYPEMSWAVKAFVGLCHVPVLRDLITTQWSLAQALRLGVANRSRLRPDAMAGFCAPFVEPAARRALAKAGGSLHPDGFHDIARWVRGLQIPVRVIYGARDLILPDIATTASRLARDLPHAQVTALVDCGHFLQEERPEDLGGLLATFFA